MKKRKRKSILNTDNKIIKINEDLVIKNLGDSSQNVYDSTNLDFKDFINNFTELEFDYLKTEDFTVGLIQSYLTFIKEGKTGKKLKNTSHHYSCLAEFYR